MSEQRYLADVRRALSARGVWGAEARRILEQLADHWQSMTADLATEGAPRAAAEQRTLAALGRPSTIADAAAAEIRSRRWLSRHPWLLGGVGTFIALLFLWAATLAVTVLFAGGFLSGQSPDAGINVQALETGAVLANWLPFFAGCLFLLWCANRSPGGWKAMLLAGVAVGLAASAFHVNVHSPVDVPGSGGLSAGGQTWTALLLLLASPFSELIRQAVPAGSLASAFHVAALLKLTLPVTAILLARQKLRRLGPA